MQVILIAAQSLDGFITRHDTPGAAFTSAADKAWFRTALEMFDVGVLGGVTYRAEREHFLANRQPGRRRVVLTRQPEQYATDAKPDVLEFTNEGPKDLAARLRGLGHHRCALLGGSQIHSLFLDAGLVNELWITLEPRLFGGGTPLLAARTDTSLRLLGTQSLGGDTVLVKYAVHS